MNLNLKIQFTLLLAVLINSSCSSVFTFEKRHYRPGFYFHTGQNHEAQKSQHQKITNNTIETANSKATQLLPITELADTTFYNEMPIKFSETKPQTVSIVTARKKIVTFLNNDLPVNCQPALIGTEPVTPYVTARKKSRLYLLLGIAFLVISVLGIGDFFPLAFLSGIYFLILSIINVFRKRRYNYDEAHPSEMKPPKAAESKIRRSKRAHHLFLALSLLFLIGALIVPPLITFTFIFLFVALVLFARWRKLVIGQADEQSEEAKLRDRTDGKTLSANVWLSLFGFLCMAFGLTLAVSAFLVIAYEATTGALLAFLLGLAIWIGFAIFSRIKGALALETGRKIMARRPNARFYKYRGRAIFGKFIGKLCKRPWLFSLLAVLFYVLLLIAAFA